MSGPKCSAFQLSEERRREELRKIEEQLQREVEERRREEERRLEEEKRRAAEEKMKRQEENRAYNTKIKDEVAALKEKLLKQREQEIIAEAIDEAMEELGYDLIASKETKADAEIYAQAQVFSFAEGVGVQVIETGDRISMEVVGIGTNNRQPTDTESEYLEAQMGEFCDAYEKLEEKLREKGIVKTNTIRRLPPNKKYARILNVENFVNKKNIDTLQTIMRKNTKKTQDNLMAVKRVQKKRME